MVPFVLFSWAESFSRLWYSFGDSCSHTSHSRLALLSFSERSEGAEKNERSSGIIFFHSLCLSILYFLSACPGLNKDHLLLSPSISSQKLVQHVESNIFFHNNLLSGSCTTDDTQLIINFHFLFVLVLGVSLQIVSPKVSISYRVEIASNSRLW